MPDWQSEYQRIVHEARRQTVSDLTRQTRRAMAREYARQMQRVLRELEQIDFDDETEAIRRRFLANLEDALNRYAARAELQVKNFIDEAALEAVSAHREALGAAETATGASVEASFSGVPEQAIESMFARRGLSVTNSYKTLTRFSAEASAQMVEDALGDALTGGRTPQEAVEGVMQGIVQGNPEAKEIIENLGPRGGLRRGGEVPGIEGAREAAKRIGFNARRIALTEINTAYWESDRLSAEESPVVKALRWVLSAAHPERDICDVYHLRDAYDLGDGVYPAEVLPTKPHPFCLCSTSPVFHAPESWGDQVQFDDPSEADEDAIRDLLTTRKHAPTNREVERTARQFNRSNRRAFDFWTGQQGEPPIATGSVKDALRNELTDETSQRQFGRAMQAIDRTHNIDDLPEIPVTNRLRLPDSNGFGEFVPHKGRAFEINVDPKARAFDQREAFVHESGHLVDFDGLPGQDYASVRAFSGRGGVLDDWAKAVQDTREYKLLKQARDTGRLDGQDVSDMADTWEYLAEPQELWARSYSQYVARKSGDVSIRHAHSKRNTQWSKDSFDAIEEAMDTVFEQQGWR